MVGQSGREVVKRPALFLLAHSEIAVVVCGRQAALLEETQACNHREREESKFTENRVMTILLPDAGRDPGR